MANYQFLFVLLIIFVVKIHTSKLFRESKLVGRDQNEINKHNIKEEWFVQYLDHFDVTDTRRWKQRYFINDRFYKDASGGPVFLMIGGEGEPSIEWMGGGNWIDNAKRFGALCFQLEHRFYGKSRPTEDLSTENLRYLTVEQALEDIAEFIVAMNKEFNVQANTKWIAFGGSYPGTLAAWLRLKYPHLVHGAVSSSSVLLSQVDYSGYLEVVAESLGIHSEECINAVKDGISEVGELLERKKGQEVLNKLLRLCDVIEESAINKKDIATLYYDLASNFAAAAQLNKVNTAGLYGKIGNVSIDSVCDIMVNKEKGSLVNRLADVNTLNSNKDQRNCLLYKYDKLLAFWRNTSWEAAVDNGKIMISMTVDVLDRQWMYQRCSQIGLFPTSSALKHTFGNKFPVEYYIQQCEDVFGPTFSSSFIYDTVRRTGTAYGNLNISVTNTVIIQGSRDPWHLAGITQNTTHGPPVIYIEGTAHMADMFPESENDLPQLKAARKQITQYINTWLRQ